MEGREVKPYYEHAGITIYHADCREVLPTLGKVDAVVTDPPYPDYYAEEYGYADGILSPLESIPCQQFVFWSARAEFPLSYSAIHIWDKQTGTGTQYERIFERNGSTSFGVFRDYRHNNALSAGWCGDESFRHPSQKPIRLMRKIVERTTGTVLDPFCGSGSTLRACKDNGRTAIGIEIEERYCEIAANRLSQEVLFPCEASA